MVKWFTTVIRFESEVLPHCSCRVWLWNQSHLCFNSIKSQLALPSTCCSSRGSHAALCVMSGAPETKWLIRGFMWVTQGKQISMQMEIIESSKIVKLVFIYHTINWFIVYCDRPSCKYPSSNSIIKESPSTNCCWTCLIFYKSSQ